MRLKRAYSFSEGMSPAVQEAVRIADALPTFASDTQVEEVLATIPQSTDYFTFVAAEEHGDEIWILVPDE